MLADRYRAPLLWIAPLIASLLWLGLPAHLQPWWPLVPALIVLTALGAAALLIHGQRRAARKSITVQPVASPELPIILVVGPHAAAVFDQPEHASVGRHYGGAVWLLVPSPDELAESIATIKASHQRWPDAVWIPVVPDGDRDDATLRQQFSRWRYALDQSTRHRACALPCYIAIYACLGARSGAVASPLWYGDVVDIDVVHISGTQPASENARQRVRVIRQQLDRAWLSRTQGERTTPAGLAHSVFDWLEDTALLSILTSLANTAPFSLRGVLLADVGYLPPHHGAWTRWLTGKTSLQLPRTSPEGQPLPLPDISACRIAGVSVAHQKAYAQNRLIVHAVAASAVALVVSLGVAGWSNSRLVARVTQQLDGYRRTPESLADARRVQVEALRTRDAELAGYARGGVPATLGWGFYRGTELQAPLERAIAEWRPPVVGVTIDNLSLFDSGKTTLKPGAEPRLRSALDLIRANPDKRILIAGHTDNVGSSSANQKLSEARARAIRDWFVNTAALPVTRFAIQGYGDTQPLASNQTDDGRAMNRRVEITLILDSSER
ncbi:OmpA family protein [Paraburkholderia sp. MMS20-SJTR3]|uniref:OmpA family protein n=1 Tax=Paraburkholderia sejongensis TaxID=2886946 RepID=A0ABS8K0M0_9BURK|nr:OmpA family protein [Paraburkholderia sp. MMS20-SJTR3]MCC8395681.1 OmpA family protein [Paraburkholderia sp. MMS20-SJTR3]